MQRAAISNKLRRAAVLLAVILTVAFGGAAVASLITGQSYLWALVRVFPPLGFALGVDDEDDESEPTLLDYAWPHQVGVGVHVALIAFALAQTLRVALADKGTPLHVRRGRRAIATTAVAMLVAALFIPHRDPGEVAYALAQMSLLVVGVLAGAALGGSHGTRRTLLVAAHAGCVVGFWILALLDDLIAPLLRA